MSIFTLVLKNIIMKTVLLATLDNSFQANILQNVLENEGIESFTKNEVLSSVFGNISGFQMEVLVYEKDYEKAVEILKKGFPHLLKK